MTKVDVFKQMKNLDTSGAEAKTEAGGVRFWPGDSPELVAGQNAIVTCTCAITDFVFDPEMITRGKWENNKKTGEYTNPGCYFVMEIVDAPDHPEWVGKTVYGSRFEVPLNSPEGTEQQKESRKKQEDRFSGYLLNLCGTASTDWGTDIQTVLDYFKGLPTPADDDDLSAYPQALIDFATYCMEQDRREGSGRTAVVKKALVKYNRDYCKEVIFRPGEQEAGQD